MKTKCYLFYKLQQVLRSLLFCIKFIACCFFLVIIMILLACSAGIEVMREWLENQITEE